MTRSAAMPLPAEHFPVGHYIREEMEVRGWTEDRLAIEMNKYHLQVTRVALDFTLAELPEPNLILDQETAEDLGRAFGVSPDFFLNLDRQYREWLKAKGGA